MSFVIVPNTLRDAIQAAIAKKLDGMPPADEDTLKHLYHQVLSAYDELGYIPDFDVVPTPPEAA